jgi:glycerophosphoryl diester phosphodiesterase
MPENTIPAMLKAIDLGVTTLEMDVVVTSDKKLILSHEPFFNHDITTTPDGGEFTAAEEKGLNIYQMSFKETQKYDVGLKTNPRFPQQEKLKAVKPLLSDIIDDVEAYIRLKGVRPVFYNIETKTTPATDGIFHPAPEVFVDLLMEVIKKKRLESLVIIQSFDYRTLQILHRKYPNIKTAALIEDFDKKSIDVQLSDLGFTPTIYSPHYSLVNADLILKCHDRKIRVIPWTVNDKQTIDKLKALGVDGIITDYPNLF